MEFTKFKNVLLGLFLLTSFTVNANNDWVKNYKDYLPTELQDDSLINQVKSEQTELDDFDLSDPSLNGYQMKMIGHKFALVINPDGSPLAIFDLSMNDLTWDQIALGTISFGDYSLLSLWNMWKKTKKSLTNAQDLSSNENVNFKKDKKNIEELKELGLKYFGKLRFTKEWAERNGFDTEIDDGKVGVPFNFASFKISDLEFEDEELKRKFLAPFAMIASTMYPNKVWTQDNLISWTNEFEFVYNKENPGYSLKWDRTQRMSSEDTPKLPSVILNYNLPFMNVINKINYYRIQQYGEIFVQLFGAYGIVIDYFMSRLTWNLIERLDYHEKQLVGVLNANLNFEFESELPDDFVDTTTDLVYSNYMKSTSQPYLGNGRLTRRALGVMEDTNNEILTERLKRIGEKKNLSFDQVSGGNFIIARSTAEKDQGKLMGIFSGTINPTWLFKRPSVHVKSGQSAWKIAERYLLDTIGYLSRVLIPNNFYFRMWNIAVGIRLPAEVKDLYVRERMIDETSKEGELVSVLDQAIRGKMNLPMTRQELVDTRKELHSTYINPFKIGLKEEQEVIHRNFKVLKRAVYGDNQSSLQDPSNFSPMFY